MVVHNTYHYMVHHSHVPFDPSQGLGKYTFAWSGLPHVPRIWYVFRIGMKTYGIPQRSLNASLRPHIVQ